jgi:hypothetical protein
MKKNRVSVEKTAKRGTDQYSHREPLPLVSGNSRAKNPAIMKIAPAIKIGSAVFKFAYNAITGAYTDLFQFTIQSAGDEISTHHNTTNTIPSSRQSIPSSSIFGWEQFRGDGI